MPKNEAYQQVLRCAVYGKVITFLSALRSFYIPNPVTCANLGGDFLLNTFFYFGLEYHLRNENGSLLCISSFSIYFLPSPHSLQFYKVRLRFTTAEKIIFPVNNKI